PQRRREDDRDRTDEHRDDVPALPSAHIVLEARPGTGDPEHLGVATAMLLPHHIPPSARRGPSPPRPSRTPVGEPGPGQVPRYAAPTRVTSPGPPLLPSVRPAPSHVRRVRRA